MSAQALEESHVSWDVEGWVKAALRNWAHGYEEIQILSNGERISISVYGEQIAVVRVYPV